MLSSAFLTLTNRYSTNATLISDLWQDLSARYAEPHRHYHTLQHLEAMFREYNPITGKLQDNAAFLFALFYHDSIYDPEQKDNEARSALLAHRHLSALHVPADTINRCNQMILATREHKFSEEADINLFTDADLAILGQDWPVYDAYRQHIRSEYGVYPDPAYRNGRSQALKHILQMEHIYKTLHFRERYESQARNNIEQELELLSAG